MLKRCLSLLLFTLTLFGSAAPFHADAATPSAVAPAATIQVVEYYNASLGHYFITGSPTEMAMLDTGVLRGWSRTGQQFSTYTASAAVPGLSPVCRFYGRPEAGLDSHFYSASPTECDEVARRFGAAWALEAGNVFYTQLPNLVTGICPASTMPVYRLFNNRADVNHRYTTDPAVREAMLQAGYAAEGYGEGTVAFCVPFPWSPIGSSATFSAIATTPDTISFSATASFANGETASSYTWAFGDGSTATGATTSHKYAIAGTHTVVLIVKGTKGNSVVAVKGVTVTVDTPLAPPAASIIVTVRGPASFDFGSTASPSTGAVLVAHTWNYGDETTGFGSTSSHTYTKSGTFPVVLTITDNKGKTATASTSVTATVAVANPPTATISATMVAADTYKLDAVASAASGATLASYAWAFGDGATGNGASVTHTYAASGTYVATLTVKDSNGKSVTTSKTITVTIPTTTPPPTSTPTPPPTSTPTPPPTSTPAPPPVIGAPGAWTKYAISYAAGNEAEYQSWYNLAYDPKRDVFYGVSWMGVIASFSPSAGGWTKLSPDIGGGVHNRTTAYDPLNDRVWLGAGTGSTLTGVNYFDPNTKKWISHPMTGPVFGTQSAMIYDAASKRFIVFGGWNLLSVKTWSVNPPAASMVDAGVSGGPVYNSDAMKMTAWRSDLDTKRNQIFFVDTDGSLWFLPLPLSGWQHVLTSGKAPPAYTQFVYDAANDAIVGWSASPRVSGGDPIPGTTRETWLLPMSTMTWTQAASFAGGQTVPPDAVYVAYAMAYDPVRQQTILHSAGSGGNFDPTTWAYRYPTTGTNPPPPPNPPPAAAPTASITATGTASDTYRFDAVASAASGRTIASYAWTFGDGASGAGASVTHTYAASGTYTASLTVADSAGSTTTVSKSVTASVPAVTPPPTSPPPPSPPPPPTNVPTYTGKITSFPLPALATAPFSSVKASKHTNMASDGKRIYVSGGDWVHSATDGTWSMSLADGTWRQDVGAPVYPTLPAPHALQDGAGFAWVPGRGKFLLWPGSYFAYDAAGSPILEYSKGMWWLDPVTNTYQQELAFFGTYGSSTGSVNGGVFDEVNEHIVEFGDSSSGFAARRWDVKNLVRLPDVAFSVTNPATYASYFTRAKHVKIGRDVYIVGYRTNGNVSSQTPLLLRWNLDTQKMQELAIPPVDGTLMKDLEIRLATSHGKVVWPFMNGPEGNLMGIWIYDPATNVWKVDTQVPTYGNFIGNSVCSLPDGRACFSGGSFGKQQTHIWFYEAL